MPEMGEARGRIESAHLRDRASSVSIAMGSPPAMSSNEDRSRSYSKISPDASRPGATRSHQISDAPRSNSTRVVCSKREPANGINGSGKIFQVPILGDLNDCVLARDAIGRAAAIHARGARGRHLRLRAGFDVDAPLEIIGVEDAAGHVVNVGQSFSRGRGETSHHAPGRLLRFHAQDGPSGCRFK